MVSLDAQITEVTRSVKRLRAWIASDAALLDETKLRLACVLLAQDELYLARLLSDRKEKEKKDHFL